MKSFEKQNTNAFPPQYQDFKDIFEKKNVKTYYHNTNHMTM
jgi:hypothetical protein